jgi:hypothetical protein
VWIDAMRKSPWRRIDTVIAKAPISDLVGPGDAEAEEALRFLDPPL